MEYKHTFKRFFQRIAIDITRKLDYRTMDKSTYGKECFLICQKLIENMESELIVSPLTGKRYIKNNESSIFVIIQGRTVQIINHIYSYSIHLDDKTYERIISTFNHEQEKRCIKLESEAEVNIKHSLKNIINNLQK
jgi:hypothetical protein